MSDRLTSFQWRIPCKGVELTRAGDDGRSGEQIIREIAASGEAPEVYKPLEREPSLFRELSELEMTGEAFAEFANKYGFLGFTPGISLADSSTALELEVLQHERISIWRTAVTDIRDAYELYCAFSKNDRSWLKSRIEIDGSDATYIRLNETSSKQSQEIQSIDMNDYSELQGNQKRSRRHVAQAILQEIVNKRLKKHTSWKLSFHFESKWPKLIASPSSLLGAAWLQLAEAIDGRHESRKCPRCGRWFLISSNSKRRHDVFCRSSCRVAAYRARKERAIDMADEGLSVKEIAREVGSTEETVRRWIAIE